MSMIELTVTIKGDDRNYKQKFLIYEPVTMTEHDPEIKKCLQEALSAAKIENPNIKIRANMDLS